MAFIRPMPIAPGGTKPRQELLQIARQFTRTPTAPSRPRTPAPAPRPAPRPAAPTGPTPAQIAARERAAAEARARTAANNAARTSAQSDLERLNAQISANLAKRNTNTASLDALKKLVSDGKGSHGAVRDEALRTLDQALTTKLTQIDTTFGEALGDFRTNLRDNEASEHDASFTNLANRARETQDVVTQALSQGAGESDVLRAQLQSLRNWSANQADVNRSFFDTRSSVNAGITDLNTSTQTARMNEELSTGAAKAQRWDDYYERQADTYADMANLDQNNYLLQEEIGAVERQKGVASGLLSWLDSGKNAEDYKPPQLKSTAASAPSSYTSDYARLAAQAAGSTWTNPGISRETQNFQGAATSTGGLNTTGLSAMPTSTALGATGNRRRPEGATLRRW